MNKEKLIECGIDYEDGMHRFCDNSKMYEKYLAKLTALTLMDELKDFVQKGDYSEAFKVCHKLKAFIGNLSIPSLYKEIYELTETLRAEQVDGEKAKIQLATAEKLFAEIKGVIAEEMK